MRKATKIRISFLPYTQAREYRRKGRVKHALIGFSPINQKFVNAFPLLDSSASPNDLVALLRPIEPDGKPIVVICMWIPSCDSSPTNHPMALRCRERAPSTTSRADQTTRVHPSRWYQGFRMLFVWPCLSEAFLTFGLQHR